MANKKMKTLTMNNIMYEIVDEYARINLENYIPKFTTITLFASKWIGDSNPYSQEITVNNITENSKLDLQPTATQIVELQDKEITLMLQNNNGTVTAWAIGNKPTDDYTISLLIQEVLVI